jgi:hypothetical protein
MASYGWDWQIEHCLAHVEICLLVDNLYSSSPSLGHAVPFRHGERSGQRKAAAVHDELVIILLVDKGIVCLPLTFKWGNKCVVSLWLQKECRFFVLTSLVKLIVKSFRKRPAPFSTINHGGKGYPSLFGEKIFSVCTIWPNK